MLFTVVIPAHNAEATIVRAVESALSQELLAEVIVVDDGSTDTTAEMARGIDDARVQVIQQANAGPASARNTGAAAATASHLLFLDSDDHLVPEALLTFAAGNDDRLLVRSGAVWHRDDGDEVIALAADDPRAFPRGAPLAGSFVVAREVFESIGGYDAEFHYGENSELLLRAAAEVHRRGGATSFVGAATVVWERAAEERSDKYDTKRLAAAALMAHKHADLLDPDALHNHHAIASELHRRRGQLADAQRHAFGALRARPTSPRAWVRLGRVVALRLRARIRR